jgi:polysaccharide biosynthesis protein PslH
VVASPENVGRTPLTTIKAATRIARESLPLHTLLGARDWRSALADAGIFDTAIVLLTRTDPWAFHAAPARRWILDAIDSAAVGMAERAAAAHGPARTFWNSEARKSARLERDAATRYDSVVTVTAAESEPFGDKGVVLPIGVAIAELRNTPRTIDFGFWGRLAYFANEEAVRTIVTRLWPRIRRQRPAATLFVGGAEAPGWIRRLHGRDGISVESPMSDRDATLRSIRVALLPISFGSGQSLKTLEAAEAGCAIAGTTLAFRGCDHLAGVATIDDDLDRLADRAVALLTDDEARSSAASELRERVVRFYSRQNTLTAMARLAGVA